MFSLANGISHAYDLSRCFGGCPPLVLRAIHECTAAFFVRQAFGSAAGTAVDAPASPSPFVHAHYGNSFEHGWHMHLLPSRTLQPAAEHRAATDAAGHHYTQSLSTDESAEVDMEQGLPPDDSNAIALPATMWEGAAEACSSGASL